MRREIHDGAGWAGKLVAACALLVLLLPSCSTAPTVADAGAEVTVSAAPPSPTAPPRPATDSEEVHGVIQLLWPTAFKLTGIDWRWSVCADNTIDFKESRDCLQSAIDDADAAVRAAPSALKVTTFCGKETEAAHRAQFAGKVAYLRDKATWMDKRQVRLRALMKERSLSSAWGAMGDAEGAGYPIGTDDKYGGVGLLRITKLGCVRQYLGCGESDVCVQNKANAQTGMR
jgi:hypothetical protein